MDYTLITQSLRRWFGDARLKLRPIDLSSDLTVRIGWAFCACRETEAPGISRKIVKVSAGLYQVPVPSATVFQLLNV